MLLLMLLHEQFKFLFISRWQCNDKSLSAFLTAVSMDTVLFQVHADWAEKCLFNDVIYVYVRPSWVTRSECQWATEKKMWLNRLSVTIMAIDLSSAVVLISRSLLKLSFSNHKYRIISTVFHKINHNQAIREAHFQNDCVACVMQSWS